MDRRRFLLTSVAGVFGSPLASEGQQAGKARIGLLTGGSEPGSRTRWDAFREGLRDLGYVDGQSIAFEYRYGNDNYDRLPALAAELVRLNVSVIVANGTPASLAAKHATSGIPIVMVETADPVSSRLVSSLAKPGGNITGVAQLVSADVFGKQLEMLKEILPSLSRVGLLFNPANPVQWTALSATQVAAQGLGVTVQPLGVDNPSEFETTLATAARNGVVALIVTRDNIFLDHVGRLVDLTARYRMPTMYGSRPFTSAGGLIAYGPDAADLARRASVYVDRILAYKDGGRVRLLSRNGVDHARRFRDVAAAIAALPVPTLVLDGEVAIFDDQLRSRFELLRGAAADIVHTPPVYIAFDVLYHKRADLVAAPIPSRDSRYHTPVVGIRVEGLVSCPGGHRPR